jgi:hypothetical protein
MDSHILELASGDITNGKINVRPCGLKFFPDGILGGSTKKDIGNQITINASGIDIPIETDIPTVKNKKTPRWFFRERKWVKPFIKVHQLSVGDRLKITRLSNKEYKSDK